MENYHQHEDLRIVYVTATSFPEGIQEAFRTLEGKAGTTNRVFFGLSKPDKGRIMYRAGVLEAYLGEAEKLNCSAYILEKGAYLAATVYNFMDNITEIGNTFQRLLLAAPRLNEASWCVEWYKGNDVMCMVKIKEQ